MVVEAENCRFLFLVLCLLAFESESTIRIAEIQKNAVHKVHKVAFLNISDMPLTCKKFLFNQNFRTMKQRQDSMVSPSCMRVCVCALFSCFVILVFLFFVFLFYLQSVLCFLLRGEYRFLIKSDCLKKNFGMHIFNSGFRGSNIIVTRLF